MFVADVVGVLLWIQIPPEILTNILEDQPYYPYFSRLIRTSLAHDYKVDLGF
jgi:hypothetical protein